MSLIEGKKIVSMSVGFPGAKRPLEEGSKLGWWDFHLLGDGPVRLNGQPDLVILAAWIPEYAGLIEQLRKGSSKVGILWTSSVGEMDFEGVERRYLQEVLENPKISFVWFGDRALGLLYPKRGFYARYPFDVKGYTTERPLGAKKANLITLFCPAGPKKNVLNQLVAVALAQREFPGVVLHTNVDVKGLYPAIAESLNLVQYGWLPHGEYENLIASAKVNLAVSHAETYNYQVVEAGLLGTTSLIGPTVNHPGITVVNPNDSSEISYKLTKCLTEFGSPNSQMRYLWDETQRIHLARVNHLTHEELVKRLTLVLK